ncbi:MAG TPA: diacylglycerol kinase family protein [Solirubrobacteraceae bacterium]|nr:diacylglycerol kinase family protein [Solirubrobacteraceae bacterium]
MSATDYEPDVDLATELGSGDSDSRKRLLMIVNPYATTVSSRLKNLVISALRGSYVVDAVDTERRDHATELCREAADEGYDAIVAFGGDGTANEAANGLAGTRTPLTCLPGGRANVYCRMLGIPADVVDATEHLLALASNWHPHPVDLGRVGGRYFLFSAGVGLDASVVERVDAHPRLKARLGEYYYAWVATSTFSRRYLIKPPRLAAELGSSNGNAERERERLEGVTVLVQNASPYTYFGDRGVEMAEGVSLDSGDLAGLILKRTSPLDIPSIAWRALSSHAKITDHRKVRAFSAEKRLVIRSLDERELPVQVDGDFIGTASEYAFSVAPGALSIVA